MATCRVKKHEKNPWPKSSVHTYIVHSIFSFPMTATGMQTHSMQCVLPVVFACVYSILFFMHGISRQDDTTVLKRFWLSNLLHHSNCVVMPWCWCSQKSSIFSVLRRADVWAPIILVSPTILIIKPEKQCPYFSSKLRSYFNRHGWYTKVSNSFQLTIPLYCHNVHVIKSHALREQNRIILQSLSSCIQN